MAAFDRRPRALLLRPYKPEADLLAVASARALERANVESLDPRLDTAGTSKSAIDAIDRADFVMADVTGNNPNVLFELGYAYGRGKLALLLVNRSRPEELPFDVRDFLFLFYQDDDLPSLESRLTREVEQLARRVTVAA